MSSNRFFLRVSTFKFSSKYEPIKTRCDLPFLQAFQPEGRGRRKIVCSVCGVCKAHQADWEIFHCLVKPKLLPLPMLH